MTSIFHSVVSDHRIRGSCCTRFGLIFFYSPEHIFLEDTVSLVLLTFSYIPDHYFVLLGLKSKLLDLMNFGFAGIRFWVDLMPLTM